MLLNLPQGYVARVEISERRYGRVFWEHPSASDVG